MTKTRRQPDQYAKVFTQKYGKAWLDWTPECLYTEIKEDFSMRPSPEDWEVIQAVRTHLKTNIFFTDAGAFENMVLAVNLSDVHTHEVQLCNPEEMAYAVKALLRVKRKPQNVDWSRDVKGYVAACCRIDGFVIYPDALRFAMDRDMAARLPESIKPTMVESHGEAEHEELDMITVQQNKLFAVNEYVSRMMGDN